jgi:hypothetical protein
VEDEVVLGFFLLRGTGRGVSEVVKVGRWRWRNGWKGWKGGKGGCGWGEGVLDGMVGIMRACVWCVV